MTHPRSSPDTLSPTRLLICGFGPFPGFPDNPASRVVERLKAANWAPERSRTAYQTIPTTWCGGYRAAAAARTAFGAQGVLILGVAGGADSFRVEICARNRAAIDRPDALGAVHGHKRISAAGPAVAFASGPTEAMVAAITAAGLPVHTSQDAGDYLCNQVFYRLLTESGPAPPLTAFLHLPPGLDLDVLELGAKAAATALGGRLVETP
ncbi:MAG TPA: hypothetical protein VL358_04900 [Caulobacteraceae bacterium]|jgi:pyroglutamyl-peptidase|nr:hypothetical protein [Caulobacteraceae bacterium]